jgi:hypothetical protein
LFRGGRDAEGAEVASKLDGIETSASGGPILGSKLEIAVARPVRQNAEHVAQVELGIELVQPSGGDQREEITGCLGVVVGADKEPGVKSQACLPTAIWRSSRSE